MVRVIVGTNMYVNVPHFILCSQSTIMAKLLGEDVDWKSSTNVVDLTSVCDDHIVNRHFIKMMHASHHEQMLLDMGTTSLFKEREQRFGYKQKVISCGEDERPAEIYQTAEVIHKMLQLCRFYHATNVFTLTMEYARGLVNIWKEKGIEFAAWKFIAEVEKDGDEVGDPIFAWGANVYQKVSDDIKSTCNGSTIDADMSELLKFRKHTLVRLFSVANTHIGNRLVHHKIREGKKKKNI